MRVLLVITLMFLFPVPDLAQRTQKMRNLWTKAQVHIIFGQYRVSYAVRDINKALALLRQGEDSALYPQHCWLDTAKNYTYELQAGTRLQYRDGMEPVLQQLVGAYLLTVGMAEVEDSRLKKLPDIIVDIRYTGLSGEKIFADFYDPANKAMIFSGEIPAELYNKEFPLDDW